MSRWQKRVYRRRIKDYISKDTWQKIRMACLRRDKFMCQRCEKISKQGRGLGAHHLIPRDEDGSNDLTNLVTLCNPCHDFVEVSGFRTLAEIIGSYEEAPVLRKKEPPLSDEGYSFRRPVWHRAVYGAGRN